MKLNCLQSDLTTALSIVNRAVSPNNTLPVLNNILLKAEGKKLFLSATNLEIAINASIDADVKNEGALTVPAKVLTGYVSLLRDEKVDLSVVNGTTLEVETTGSDTKMKGISSDEFPLLPKLDKPDSFKLPCKSLGKMIEDTVFSASTNISRPVLTGLFWKIAGKTMKLAATDSYRLSEKTVELEKDLGLDLSFILPSKTAHELAKVLSLTNQGEIEVKVTKNQIKFKVDGIELMSRLIEGNYPDYQKILPKESKTSARLKTEDMVLGLKKVSVIVKENNNNVKVSIEDGKVLISSDETQVGQGTVELPAETEGEKLVAALNVQYLLDVLSHIGDNQVNFGLNDGLSPVKVVPVKASGALHIIMPLKV
jgi:DNA polymerase III subunit beta